MALENGSPTRYVDAPDVSSGEPIYIQRGFAAATILLVLVLVLFVVARLLARQRTGR
jgi:phosphate transport system permease protein